MIPYENHLITGLLDEKGDVYNLIQELSLDQNIYTVAQDGQYLYLGTTSQLNRWILPRRIRVPRFHS